MNADHDGELRPYAVSATSYHYHRCRCSGCTAAATEYQRRMRRARGGALVKVESRTVNTAAAWVRSNHPDVWEQFKAQAYEHFGIERRRRGNQGRPA